jgi:hypothetical protein
MGKAGAGRESVAPNQSFGPRRVRYAADLGQWPPRRLKLHLGGVGGHHFGREGGFGAQA